MAVSVPDTARTRFRDGDRFRTIETHMNGWRVRKPTSEQLHRPHRRFARSIPFPASPIVSTDADEPSESTRLARPVDEHDHVRGPDDAAVTLVQYGEFNHPDCVEVYPEIEAIRDRLGDRLRYVYRYFPVAEVHPRAKHAAEAAEAAGAQGAFWEMHDRLYERPDELSDAELVDHADELGLDTDRFAADLKEGAYEARLNEDVKSGAESGAEEPPALSVNGER